MEICNEALFFGLARATLLSMAAYAQDQQQSSQACSIPAATVKLVQSKLATVVTFPDFNRGIFLPALMWSAVVDRKGILCSVMVTGDAWPSSRAIAIAKAETGNDFSNSKLAMRRPASSRRHDDCATQMDCTRQSTRPMIRPRGALEFGRGGSRER
jgi:hypothetical protein